MKPNNTHNGACTKVFQRSYSEAKFFWLTFSLLLSKNLNDAIHYSVQNRPCFYQGFQRALSSKQRQSNCEAKLTFTSYLFHYKGKKTALYS